VTAKVEIANVRRMRGADVMAVAEMTQALADFHGDTASVNARYMHEHCLGPKKLGSVLVAVSGRHPVGFVLTYDWMNFVRNTRVRHIDLMFVQADFRRRGVGEALMKVAATLAVEDECGRMTVSAQADNEQANGFYRKLGFESRPSDSNRYHLTDAGLLALSKRTDGIT
jgi:ribosomal protein S18 acetylase RimI-like enzyme